MAPVVAGTCYRQTVNRTERPRIVLSGSKGQIVEAQHQGVRMSCDWKVLFALILLDITLATLSTLGK